MSNFGSRVTVLFAVAAALLSSCDASGNEASVEAGGNSTSSSALVAVPGTGLQLVPPVGFAPSEEFPGFAHMESGTSIMVTEIPGPFAQVSGGFQDPAMLAQQGMVLIESSALAAGEHPGLLVRLSQDAQGIEVSKWTWIFGTPDKTVMILGTCVDEDYMPRVRESILTATWDPDRKFDVTEGLGFELTDTSGLILWQRIGNMLAYTSDGQPDLERTSKPMLTIGPAVGSGPIADQQAFAEQRIKQLPLDDVVVRTSDAIEIDGLRGLALTASAKDDSSGEANFVYQVILFEEDNYWLGVGLGATRHEEEYLPIFKRTIASLRR